MEFEFKNLKKIYPGKVLFENISYKFPNRGIVAILGTSGEGKTTLFHVLTGLENKDDGQIFFNKKELITTKDFSAFRSKCGFVFQEYGILNYLSSKDNLFLGGYDIKPQKSDTLLNEKNYLEKAGFLSGGEKQRLAIKKSLELNPEILFCDEPTGALDYQTSIDVMNILKEVSKECLVILITHNKELSNRYADVILKLENHNLKIQRNKQFDSKKLIKEKRKRSIYKHLNIPITSFFQEKIKIIMALLSLMVCVASFLLMLNINTSSFRVINDQVYTYADVKRIKVSQIENNKIEGTSFSLSKIYQPSFDDLKKLVGEFAAIEYNLDYFFSNTEVFINDKRINFRVLTFPFGSGIEDFRLNSLAYEEIKNINSSLKIVFNQNIVTKYKNQVVEDNVKFYVEGEVIKVYKEFDFLNYPCIFLSHDAVKDYFASIKLKRLTLLNGGVFTSLYDRLSVMTYKDDPYSSYSLYVDVFDKSNLFKVIDIIKSNNNDEIKYDVESRAIMVYESLYSSIDLLALLSKMFALIGTIITLCLIHLLIQSTFLFRNKEFALYKTMGFNNLEFFILQFIPTLFFLFIGFIGGVIIYYIFKNYVASLLLKYFNCDLLKYDLLNESIIILILIIVLFLAFIYSIYPLKWIKKLNVAEVIKSE